MNVETVLGAGQREVFTDMARLHRDGWGTAWRTPTGRIAREGRPTSALSDPRLASMLTTEQATARIVHLRFATLGLACSPENTHPFVADGMAFAHNGSLEPPAALEDLLDDRRLAELRGTTDSERYFAAVRTEMARGADAFDALLTTVARLRGRFPTRSLNALVLTPTALFAVHASEHAQIPMKEFLASGIPVPDLPRHHVEGYFLMRTRRAANGSVLFASSGLDIAGWDPLPAESVTRVDLTTLAVETSTIPRRITRVA